MLSSMKPFTRSLPIACLIIALAGPSVAAEKAPSPSPSPRETPVVRVVRDWADSVVNIGTERVVLLRQNPAWGAYGPLFDDFFNQYTAPYGAMAIQGLGSGVIVSKDGLIATNAHVVQMASRIYVTLHDGTRLEAELIGTNTRDDLALIRIRTTRKLKPVRYAKDVLIGETVVAIANPLGLENSVSAGIVSGTNRKFAAPESDSVFEGLVQTDASINPGSSGGALLNLEGKLVGINLAVVQEAQNIAFAVPAAKLTAMMREYEVHLAREKSAKQTR